MQLATMYDVSNFNRFDTLFKEYNDKKQRIGKMLNVMFDDADFDLMWKYAEDISKDRVLNPSQDSLPNVNYLRKFLMHENVNKVLQREYWKKVIDDTRILDYVSSSVKEEWYKAMEEFNLPPFEMEIVKTALSGMIKDLPSLFAQRLQDAHAVISKAHKTNSAEMFNKRMIFHVANFDSRYCWYMTTEFIERKCDAINDIRSTISQILGGLQIPRGDTVEKLANIAKGDNFGQWVKIDEHVAIRLYKVGTAHLEIRPEIADMLNNILANGALPNMSDSWYNKKKENKVKEFHNFSSIVLSRNVIDDVTYMTKSKSGKDSGNYYVKDDDTLKVLKYIDKDMEYKDNFVSFSYNVKSVLDYLAIHRTIPDYKSIQFYPTPDIIVDEMYKHFNHNASILEPSAGMGGLLRDLENVTCVEINSLHSTILSSKGYKVYEMDFMKFSESNKFDVILMNPPYSKGRALSHIDKAIKHLNENGFILAVIPEGKIANLKHKYELIKTFNSVFDNTSIDTSLVKIYN